MVMHDDDLDEELAMLANLEFERRALGRYAVSAEILVGGKMQTRRIECSNPAYARAQILAEIEDMLVAQVRAEAESKRAARRKWLRDDG